MPRFSLHAIGSDRAGIVAALAQKLGEIGCNFEDSRMTILHGQFAVMLVVEAETPDGGAIERALEPIAEELNLFLAVRPLPEPQPGPPPEAACTLRIYGPAGTEVIARVTAELARHGANIVELVGRHRSAESPTSELHLELAEAEHYESLAESLAIASRELGVRCDLQRVPLD